MTEQERIELERQLAAEREARQKAEAACAEYRRVLELITTQEQTADYFRVCDVCARENICSLGAQELCEVGKAARLLAAPDPGADLLEAGRLVYRALQGMDRRCCFSRAITCVEQHDDDCPVGPALAAGERWFGDKGGKC